MTLLGEGEQSQFDPEALLALIDESNAGECFHMVSGQVGAQGETTVVEVRSYHTTITELVDFDKLKRHVGISYGFLDQEGNDVSTDPVAYPSTDITLVVPGEPRKTRYDRGQGWSFDPTDPWFRMLKASVSIHDRDIPVHVVLIDLGNGHSEYWLQKD